jgi:hypothetical protein
VRGKKPPFFLAPFSSSSALLSNAQPAGDVRILPVDCIACERV